MNFGIIGNGKWSNKLVDAIIKTGHTTTWIADRSFDWEDTYNLNKVNAVIIATPPWTHAYLLEKCIQLNKPCIVEKPFCLNSDTALDLHNKIEDIKLPVLVDHTRIFDTRFEYCKNNINKDDVKLIRSEGGNLGPFRKNATTLWDWIPHDLALCLSFYNSYPSSIQSIIDDDEIAIKLKFGSKSAWIHAGRIFNRKIRDFSLITDIKITWYDITSDTNLITTTDYDKDDKKVETITLNTKPPLERMIDYFANGLNGGDKSMFGTKLAVDVVNIINDIENQNRTL